MMARKFFKEVNGENPAVVFEITAPTGFSEITDRDENISLLVHEYEKREENGEKVFNDTRASVYYDFTQGVYGDPTLAATLQAVFDLESHLSNVIIYLKSGGWLTAQGAVSALAISGLYDQDFKDSLTQIINDYVTGNY